MEPFGARRDDERFGDFFASWLSSKRPGRTKPITWRTLFPTEDEDRTLDRRSVRVVRRK